MSQCTRKRVTAQAIQEAMASATMDWCMQYIRRQGGGELSYEEALQAGRIGLWHAIEGYDPKRGTRFATYAWVAISRQIRRRARELQRERDIETLELPLAEDVSRSVEELDRERAEEALQVLVAQLSSPSAPGDRGALWPGRSAGMYAEGGGAGAGSHSRTSAATPAGRVSLATASSTLLVSCARCWTRTRPQTTEKRWRKMWRYDVLGGPCDEDDPAPHCHRETDTKSGRPDAIRAA